MVWGKHCSGNRGRVFGLEVQRTGAGLQLAGLGFLKDTISGSLFLFLLNLDYFGCVFAVCVPQTGDDGTRNRACCKNRFWQQFLYERFKIYVGICQSVVIRYCDCKSNRSWAYCFQIFFIPIAT